MKTRKTIRVLLFVSLLPVALHAQKSYSNDEAFIELMIAFFFGAIFLLIAGWQRLRTQWIPAIHAHFHPELFYEDVKGMPDGSGSASDDDALPPGIA